MATIRTTGTLGRLADSAIVRVIAYYVLLFGAAALFVQLVPGADRLVMGGFQPSPELDAGVQSVITGGGEPTPIFSAPAGLPLSEVFAMASAFALMLPVAWIYIMTRQRKGFRQSVVQTLVILPIVVAGVVFMVKNSLALAFSLGGIVAAVSFGTRFATPRTRSTSFSPPAWDSPPASSRCRSRPRSRSRTTS